MGFCDTDEEEESSRRAGISGCSTAFEFWNPAFHMQTQIYSTIHLPKFAMVFPGIKLYCWYPQLSPAGWPSFCVSNLDFCFALWCWFLYTRRSLLNLEVDIKSFILSSLVQNWCSWEFCCMTTLVAGAIGEIALKHLGVELLEKV